MKFTKMQATGNDFVVLEKDNVVADIKELAMEMCDRHFGIGADGIILIDPSTQPLYMRIYNADGSEAGICGNGLRCFAKYVFDNGLAKDYDIDVNTPSGIKRISVNLEHGTVVSARVNMGTPSFSATDIPVNLDNTASSSGVIIDYPLEISGTKLMLTFVNMGNPHSVYFISLDVNDFPLNEIGPLVENNAIFPERTNFEIANIVDRNTIKARVWERGVGETLACGSGACAIAVAASTKNLTGNNLDIMLPGGKLVTEWDINGDVYLMGTVEKVFTGEWTKWR
jgi:diaminopimelate epimerase